MRLGAGKRRPVAAILAAALLAALAAGSGCTKAVRFPKASVAREAGADGLTEAYDTDGDGRPDYFTTENAAGRKVRIACGADGDGRPDGAIDLDAISPAECRHVVIILDGIPYSVAESMYDEGRLRLFHPPSRVIPPFPAMTDTALADVFGARPCGAVESLYFDHASNRMVGGDLKYLSMENESWVRDLDYRAPSVMDGISYVWPERVFTAELADLEKLLEQDDHRDVTAYLVSTAGMDSRYGEKGMRLALSTVDRLAEQLVRDSKGRIKITIMADHGHTLRRGRRIDFAGLLRKRGWHIAGSLTGPRDAVVVEYGLLTCATFNTQSPVELAADVAEIEGVDLAACREGDAVIVCGVHKGKAVIERQGDRYRYRALEGDPLRLAPIVQQLRAEGKLDADDFAADADWRQATTLHDYPDPLDRLWRAFHGIVEHTPDVIASLDRDHYTGAPVKVVCFPLMQSTHGDMSALSTTFIMSMAGPLPPVLRSREVAGALENVLGRPWPPKREAAQPEDAAPEDAAPAQKPNGIAPG
jgi:hypothetical protein